MNLEARLRAFAAVARSGSFSRAAEELYVSQPAVSKHVATLETELGRRLFDRERKGVTLTPAGEVLADYVLRAEALLANARRAIGTGADAQRGTLALAASGIPGTYLLPELVARFHELYPDVELDFRLATSGEALELVRAHQVELALVGGLDVAAELDAEPLVEDQLVLVGPASLGGRRLRPRDIEGLTWISREEGSSTRAAVAAARWQLGLHAVRTLELPSWEAVKLAVQRGAGIAAISRFALELELETSRLAVLDVPRWKVVRTISLVTARGVPLTPPAARFVELLRAHYLPPEGAELPPNSNLPASPGSLVGRDGEVDELTELLRRSDVRLVTLTGAGGTGKTRLALEVASRLVDDFRDGVYLVEAGPLADPDHVLPTIARVVGAPAGADVADWIRGRKLLLVLDNLEHLLAAAPDLAALVQAGRTLKVLATSRAPLRLRAELRYPVEPLPAADAVALFVERALAVNPRFEADGEVRAICERLDGLPLAIELAAGRIAALPPAVLLERLGSRLPVLIAGASDLPSRQRTLRGTIEWSHDLLDADAKRAFATLAVFPGGCMPEAAEAVSPGLRDALDTLAEHGLVRRDGSRLRMLETIREYADERLADLDEADELRHRHTSYLVDLARTVRSHARGPDEKVWLDRCATELDNVRAALRWAIDGRERALGLALGEALEPFWYRRALWAEGLGWLEELLALPGDAPAEVLAGALLTAGRLALELREVDRARPWYQQAEPLVRALGDDERLAWVLHGLGHAAWQEGDLGLARATLNESAELFTSIGRHAPAGGRYSYLATLEHEVGDLDEAARFWALSIDAYGLAGDRAGVAGSLHGLGDVLTAAGRLDEALPRLREALQLAAELEDELTVAHVLGAIAAAVARLGRRAEASRLWGAVERFEEDLGVSLWTSERARYVTMIGDLDVGEAELGRALPTREAIALALELSAAP